jgi:hypothetical protein
MQQIASGGLLDDIRRYLSLLLPTDESKAQALPPGSVVVIPPGTPHFGFAKDGDVTLQEVGIGPTATIPVSSAAAQ